MELLIVLRAELAEAESKASSLASEYGRAFALYNHQCDMVKAKREQVRKAERELLDGIK